MWAPVGGGREGVKLRPRALHADCELQVRTELPYLIKFKHSVGVGSEVKAGGPETNSRLCDLYVVYLCICCFYLTFVPSEQKTPDLISRHDRRSSCLRVLSAAAA